MHDIIFVVDIFMDSAPKRPIFKTENQKLIYDFRQSFFSAASF